jgi:hypothetical protein
MQNAIACSPLVPVASPRITVGLSLTASKPRVTRNGHAVGPWLARREKVKPLAPSADSPLDRASLVAQAMHTVYLARVKPT